MAELLLAAGAAYLGIKAGRKIRSAYIGAREEMYEEQQMSNYYNQPNNFYTQTYGYQQVPSSSSGHYYPSSGYGHGNSYYNGRSYYR
jgi:hypothetical protein